MGLAHLSLMGFGFGRSSGSGEGTFLIHRPPQPANSFIHSQIIPFPFHFADWIESPQRHIPRGWEKRGERERFGWWSEEEEEGQNKQWKGTQKQRGTGGGRPGTGTAAAETVHVQLKLIGQDLKTKKKDFLQSLGADQCVQRTKLIRQLWTF